MCRDLGRLQKEEGWIAVISRVPKVVWWWENLVGEGGGWIVRDRKAVG